MILRTPLADRLATLPNVMVGYSGGVDSALVAVVARQVLGRDRAVAAIGRSASLAESQYQQAVAVARQFDVTLVEVATAELDDPRYTANAPSRCYFCKQELWRALAQDASRRGFSVIADGTNADDLADHRPGARAGAEARVCSPLAEAGYGKDAVRREAKALGIPVWDAPAAPCLSSRVRYGLTVTTQRLRQVEEGETWLRTLGIEGDLRLRHHGDEARIEVDPGQLARIRERGREIGERLLALGFARVTLDLAGYRRGNLLRGTTPEVELLAERA